MLDVCAELIVSFSAAVITITLLLMPVVLFELYIHKFYSYSRLTSYLENPTGMAQLIESRGFVALLYLLTFILTAAYFIYYKLHGLGEVKTWIVETRYIFSYFIF